MNNIDNSNSYKVTFELQDSEDEISTETYAQKVIQLFVIFCNIYLRNYRSNNLYRTNNP